MSTGPTLIWGAGAIGATIGAYLTRAGLPVVFVDRSAAQVWALNANGLAVTGPIATFQVPAAAFLPQDLSGTFRRVFLCVKAQDTATAAAELAPFLHTAGCVLSLQNGLNWDAIAEHVGRSRVLAGFVNFGADCTSPGVVHFGGRGTVAVGEVGGEITSRATEIHRLLQLFEPRAVLTPNIRGFLWSKLAYGAMLFATALTNESIADCLADARYRDVFIGLAREVTGVAAAAGIALETFDGFNPASFSSGSEAAAHASLEALVLHNRRSAKTHSGIWRDLAVHKRKTEVEALLGPVVSTASSVGLAAPLTRRLIELILEVEEGRRPLELSTLAELASE